MKIIDISNDLLTAEVYEGDPVPELSPIAKLQNGDAYNLNALYAGLHNGTHMDAPLHFLEDAPDVGAIPLETCIGPCRVIEVSPGIITGEVVENAFPRGVERILLKSGGKAFIHETAAEAMAYYGCKLCGTDGLTVEPPHGTGQTHRLFAGKCGAVRGLESFRNVKRRILFNRAPCENRRGGSGVHARRAHQRLYFLER